MARVDGYRALSTDGELRLVPSIEKYFDRVLVLADAWVWLMEFRKFVARQVLSCSAAPPDSVDFACEDLAGVEVERYLNGLPRPHIFEVLMIKGGQ